VPLNTPEEGIVLIHTSPLRRGDAAVVELWLDEARTRAVRYRFRIINEDTGKRIIVPINYLF
jgi:acyl-CoA thioester hydrolase